MGLGCTGKLAKHVPKRDSEGLSRYLLQVPAFTSCSDFLQTIVCKGKLKILSFPTFHMVVVFIIVTGKELEFCLSLQDTVLDDEVCFLGVTKGRNLFSFLLFLRFI